MVPRAKDNNHLDTQKVVSMGVSRETPVKLKYINNFVNINRR